MSAFVPHHLAPFLQNEMCNKALILHTISREAIDNCEVILKNKPKFDRKELELLLSLVPAKPSFNPYREGSQGHCMAHSRR